MGTIPHFIIYIYPHPSPYQYLLDDFVFYSTDPTKEVRFMDTLKKRVVIDFMGPVDWFLGTAFTWKKHDNDTWQLVCSLVPNSIYGIYSTPICH